MDLDDEMVKTKKEIGYYNVQLGKSTHLIVYDIRHPVKKTIISEKKQIKKKDGSMSKFKGKTIYYHFKALVIIKDGKKVPAKNHLIQMPGKTLVYQLYN